MLLAYSEFIFCFIYIPDDPELSNCVMLLNCLFSHTVTDWLVILKGLVGHTSAFFQPERTGTAFRYHIEK